MKRIRGGSFNTGGREFVREWRRAERLAGDIQQESRLTGPDKLVPTCSESGATESTYQVRNYSTALLTTGWLFIYNIRSPSE